MVENVTSLELSGFFINSGVNITYACVEVFSENTLTPLEVAINNKNSEVVKSLLAFGASINFINTINITASEFNTKVDFRNVIRVIKEHVLRCYEVDLYVCGSNIDSVSQDK
ncbi:GSCOCG00008769001-RA-CDS [Cotesia congregata]|uniref:Uncharacterized protein n=1 Tax=Cotesia congregata TaxID=51543 RepID=A0A8J2HKT9_COTCN|nr:GSCOCG00008769001-RA-CDS [Cotesia congregata]CAG5102270.1 Protein of unknown function [Cotesia congregata]